jgi:acyl transferase domain-containing protein/3-hydroxymyristoyl/3-hydroxydecanoyl-(acyl carrier protein) dehydratase/1-acyl-sn-glycerol-3-phosphate acyltransferase
MNQSTMSFEPIAIIGQSCTLPGALSPEALWTNVLAGKSSLSSVPEERWGLPRESVMGTVVRSADRSWSDVGGYVTGFQFDATGTSIPAELLLALDPVFQLTLQGVRQALRNAGQEGPSKMTGLVLGNLSFPSVGMARYAQSVWLGQSPRPHPMNRFNSGLPAHLAARALGLGGGAFALDAACASSLYAIKLACDRLQDRTADVMVAGAVNQADDLFIHVGFCALSALSKTGQSRPFHRDADGLVPAEGAGFMVLERLSDALAAGRKVLGVIRGVGLSNDGRGRGLLAPSEEGQERAMRLAYAQAGLEPSDISLVECHATGTPVGDATELRSMSRVFAGCSDVPIGSLKSNLGHLITTAGVAGLIKVLAAMEHGMKPPTLHVDQPNPALEGTPFRLLNKAEPWTGPKRACISAFGFGGNNAHLIIESLDETDLAARTFAVPEASTIPVPIAIVGVGARVGNGDDMQDFTRELLTGKASPDPRQTVAVALDGLRFPPNDLQQSLAQQTMLLEAAREAAHGVVLPRDRTSVLVGMGCDPEVARYGTRWRLATEGADPAWLAAARDGIVPLLQSSGVVGTMPNMPANRINSQLDVAGPAFTISAEEASGITALHLAVRALRAGEFDAAMVGAVDLSHEPVHQAALAELGHSTPSADAAVVLTLKRLEDAHRDGDTVFATVAVDSSSTVAGVHLGDANGGVDLAASFGKSHAANGLLHVAAAALALRHGARPQLGTPATPWFGERSAEVSVSVLGAVPAAVRLNGDEGGEVTPWLAEAPARLHVFSGVDKAGAIASLTAGRESSEGPARLVLVAASELELTTRAEQARRWLEGGGPVPEGVAFRETPIVGQVAFVFTGAAAAYPGMGCELALALPKQVAAVAARCSEMKAATDWLYGPGEGNPTHPLDQLWGTSFVCQLHAEVTQQLLGLKPEATIGYSSGESNALFALRAWNDLGDMMTESRAGTAFTEDLVGTFEAAHRAWKRLGVQGSGWANVVVAAPVEQVKAALADEPLAHLTIINTAEDCVIGGEAEACARVVQRLGEERTLPLAYDMAAHCPEVGEIRDAWWQLHHRATNDIPNVRFYTNATGTWFKPTSKAAADAITGQALHTLDFTRTIEQAWADGVRVFIEHGPRGLCSGWIRRILGEREHLVVPLDMAGRSGVRQLLNAASWLVAAGVKADVRALEAELELAAPKKRTHGAVLTLPAHAPAPKVPVYDGAVKKDGVQVMAPAPFLEPVTPRKASLPAAPSTALAPLLPTLSVHPVDSAPLSGPLALFMAQRAQVAAVHQEFLIQQAAVHERFLALQQSAATKLLHAFGAVSQGLSATAIDVMDVMDAMTVRTSPQSAPPRIRFPAAPTSHMPQPAALPGPKFDRAQLEVLASGKISTVFGPQFAGQDGYARQVRMPESPLLLADRVTGIDAVPGSMGKGALWTETDVCANSWYLDDEGRMPAGIMIESGQADLLLISWLGIDALNQGERVYRLLGCDLTWQGGLPVPGDTLCYDIHVDGHATQGDVRLFFFHYDCQVRGQTRLSVRNGQAGFFSDEELANSAGVLWDPVEEQPDEAAVDAPAVNCEKTKFSSAELKAFAAGRPYECFGTGWETTQPHVRSPRITSEKMQFLHEVTEFDPKGGPWGRGYLRAETPVTPDDWFFKGHFKNDPCMPGTLMFDGCLQAMSIYLAGLGFTIERDGWRFEPVPGTKYSLRCRGQVTPSSKHLVYEVFVTEVQAGPIPIVYADLLCTVDGRKAFHAKRVGLRLVPDWPLEHWKHLSQASTQLTGESVPLRSLAGLVKYNEPTPVAMVDGFAFDYHSLLACAWGPPSAAFGPLYAPFDGTRRAARLPGPPYHFMSRVTKIDGPIGGMQPGTVVEVEYDVPVEQWYFQQNGNSTMPFCVVMEAALQPCGWLASYVGSALTSETDMLFRNLDGTGTLLQEVFPTSGTFKTKVKLLSVSQSAGMIIENFEVECFVDQQRVFEMKTVFGFFPKEAFENQVGLTVTTEHRAWLAAPAEQVIDLSSRPEKYCGGAPGELGELCLPGPMLLMLDRITGYWPEGGLKALGSLRAEKTVDVDEWFFKAHFFQDPVQPGSLGVEALTQLLQFFMLEKGMGAGVMNPRFEPLMLGQPITWKYRGQVVPKNKIITTELQITEVGEDAQGPFAIAEGALWVDGKRIYSVKNMGMRIVPGSKPTRPVRTMPSEETLDPMHDTWLLDHCPTWTLPALPMMSMVDRLAGAVSEPVSALFDLQIHRWLPFPAGPLQLRTEVTGDGTEREVTLLAWRESADAALSRFEPVATGRVQLGAALAPPKPFAPLRELVEEADPYASGALFHGPAFQYLTSLKIGPAGSSAVLRAEKGSVPHGTLHQGLLDAATHGLPHDCFSRWSDRIPNDVVGYPYRIKQLRLFSPLPDSGELRVEARFTGFDGEARFPVVAVQLIQDGRVLADFQLVEVLLPKGPIGAAPRDQRRRFLRDRQYVPGVALSSFEGTTTELSAQMLHQSDWLPGNVTCIYGVPPERCGDLMLEVAQKEHVARRAIVHPSAVTVEPGGARAANRPLRFHPLQVTHTGDDVLVADSSPPRQDLTVVRKYWREHFDVGQWPVEDLYLGLAERFVGDVVMEDPAAFALLQGRSCLYLANHQVGVESLLFSMLISALSKTPTVTLAKAEHRTSWLGTLIAHNFSYPGVVDPRFITFFDRDDQASLLRIVGELHTAMKEHGKSVMVHVEGTRSLAGRTPVKKISSAFIDMALAHGAPIIPVRMVGGLPVSPLKHRLEFPIAFGRQDYWLGRPLLPEMLAKLSLKARKDVILATMNALGPELSTETPLPGDAQFSAAVETWRARTGASLEDAVLFSTLAELRNPGTEVKSLLDGARAGRLILTPDPRSQWLGRLAQRLFGPNGPAVEGIEGLL